MSCGHVKSTDLTLYVVLWQASLLTVQKLFKESPVQYNCSGRNSVSHQPRAVFLYCWV